MGKSPQTVCDFAFLHPFCQRAAAAPDARAEIDQTGDGIAIGRKAVAKHEAEKTHIQQDTEQIAEADAKRHAVKDRQHHAKLGAADALNKAIKALVPATGKNPGTGDNSQLGLVAVIGVLALVGIVALIVIRKKKGGK